MQNLFLTCTSVIVCVTPDNPGDEPRNCKESPDVTYGSCSKQLSDCSAGGMRVIVKFIGLHRDRQSENFESPKSTCATQVRVLRNEMEQEKERPGQGVLRDTDLGATQNGTNAASFLKENCILSNFSGICLRLLV